LGLGFEFVLHVAIIIKLFQAQHVQCQLFQVVNCCKIITPMLTVKVMPKKAEVSAQKYVNWYAVYGHFLFLNLK